MFFVMISGTRQKEECPKMYSQVEAPEITSVNQMIITWNGKHMQITKMNLGLMVNPKYHEAIKIV